MSVITQVASQARALGHAMSADEVYEGRRSLAVPIRNREGRTVAAINISAMNSRAEKDRFQGIFLPLLQRAPQ